MSPLLCPGASGLFRFIVAGTFALPLLATAARAQDERPPNVVVIFADDLGWGDLGCYGHPTIRTPHLDRMAAEGARLTQFYSGASVCTPSRAALLTGRLPVRSGMCSDRRRVLFPNSASGLPAEEVTLAEALHEQGYATACVGKWHLGHRPAFLPTRHGFDEYFGIPYSNDMDRTSEAPRGRAAFRDPRIEYWNVPLLRDEEVVERPADQNTITRRYTEEAVGFIREHQDGPFFLYLAHSLPHVPLFAHPEFRGRSLRGLFGDVIEEIDWSVGKVLETLRSLDLAERTLVFFTSDNGPWLVFGTHGGSAGLLREGKGTTWEGGMREPCLAWWPGTIPAGSEVTGLATTMDIYATGLAVAGAPLPDDRPVDGMNVLPLLRGEAASPRDTVYYYRGTRLYAVRHGPYKAHFMTQGAYGGPGLERHDPPLLFHLEHDPSERFDVASGHPEVLEEIRGVVEAHREGLDPAPSRLEEVVER